MQSKAEDEGILAYVEDDNAAMRLPGRRTCLDICLVCYNVDSAKHGISSDNILTINSGTINVETSEGDAIRSAPDAVNAESGTSGVININGGNISVKSASDGIQAAQDLTITGGNFSIQTGSGYNDSSFDKNTMSRKGIKASTGSDDSDTDTETAVSETTEESTNTITVTGGNFDFNTADDAVHADGYVIITGGHFDILTGDDGVHADTSLTLGEENGNDGAVVINVNASYEGLEAGNVYIYSGTYNSVASDDGINAASGSGSGDNFNPGGGPGGPGGPDDTDHGPGPRRGESSSDLLNEGWDPGEGGNGSADYSLNIYGGNVYVNCSGDGLDSNGTLNLEGGNVQVYSQEAGRDNAPLDCESTLYINGATVFAAGGDSMGDFDKNISSSSQSYLKSTATFNAGSTVNVTVGSEVVYSSVLPKKANFIVYSSPNCSGGNISSSGSYASYKVDFNSNGGSSVVSQTVNLGGFVTRPDDPTKDGFDFVGWYMDSALASAYDFGSKVTGDITLYAKWTESVVDSDSDTDTASDTENDSESDSETPAEDGYKAEFTADHAKINIYYTQDYTTPSEENVTTAYSRDAETGEMDRSGSGQINFSVEPDEGYEIVSTDSIKIEGTYKNLKEVTDSGIAYTYRITKITSDLTVTVNVTEKTSDTSSETASETDTSSEISSEIDTSSEKDSETESDNADTTMDTNTEMESDSSDVIEDTDSMTESDPENTESDTVSDTESDVSDKTTDTASETESDNADTTTDINTETESDSSDVIEDTDSMTESDPKDTESDTVSDTESDVSDKTTDTASDTESDNVDTTTDTDSDTESDVTDTTTDTDSDTESDVTDTTTDTDSDTESDTTTDIDTDTEDTESDSTDSETKKEYLIGDVNLDGEITADDAILVLRAGIGLEDFGEIETILADVDGDGEITSNDSMEILRCSIELEVNSDAGKTIEL